MVRPTLSDTRAKDIFLRFFGHHFYGKTSKVGSIINVDNNIKKNNGDLGGERQREEGHGLVVTSLPSYDDQNLRIRDAEASIDVVMKLFAFQGDGRGKRSIILFYQP